MKIIVTGSTGFIGKHLVKRLTGMHEVIEWDRAHGKDIKDFSSKTIPADVDFVVHLAAIADVRRSLKEPELYWKTNVEYSKNIFDLCYLFRRSKLLIANDGGACHLAAISSCPVVAITSGCNYPDAIYPINSKNFVIRNDDQHSACFNFEYCKICDDAIKDIAIYDVLKKVRLILNG